MGGCPAMNGARRAVVGLLSAVSLVKQVGSGPIAKDLGQFRVKLGERGAERALALRVGAGPEMAGDGEGGMPKEISYADANSHFAIRLLSRSAGSAALALRGARDGMVTVHRPAGWSFPSLEGRPMNLPGVHG
jgi:hypothetical protein